MLFGLACLTENEVATKTPQEAVPVLGRGALCADAMGLVGYPTAHLRQLLTVFKGENAHNARTHSRH